MSYSFLVRGAHKEEAFSKCVDKMREVAVSQACHERDKQQALNAAKAFIDLLADDDSKDVVVNMNGSLTGHWQGSDVTRIEGAAVSVSAGLAARQA